MLDYTFALHYNGSDAKHRSKSAIVFSGNTQDEVMKKAREFTKQYPDYKLGAHIAGVHAVVP